MLTRRELLKVSAAAGAIAIVPACAAKEPEKGEDVSPAEDLMREHGVLKRILLVYREGIRRLDASQDLPPQAIADSATIVRTFIEDYHEKLEEDFLFPRFRKARVQQDLVDVLEAQHHAGRTVTEETLHLANASGIATQDGRRALSTSLAAFIRMYEPHEAREDTVLFPALRTIISPNEYDALGDDFEKREHELFGKDGFEGIVERVATIEKTLGLYDLAQFTPQAR
ncbi:MAG TPA: hemerythrin domain-containing protein [Candidatus Polarisedimenticolaceae bacterium]|nr:hemerythrin domain-containing protein [Candidatus Polarisedimenticolaceae bacterium]